MQTAIISRERDRDRKAFSFYFIIFLELFTFSTCACTLTLFFKCHWDYLCGGITSHFHFLYFFLYWKRKPCKISCIPDKCVMVVCVCVCVCLWEMYSCSPQGPAQNSRPPSLGLFAILRGRAGTGGLGGSTSLRAGTSLQRQLPSRWAQEATCSLLCPWSPPRRAGESRVPAELKNPQTQACW